MEGERKLFVKQATDPHTSPHHIQLPALYQIYNSVLVLVCALEVKKGAIQGANK